MHVTAPIIKQIDIGIQPRWVAFEISEMSNGQISVILGTDSGRR